LNSFDEKIKSKANLVAQKLQKIGNLVMFFEINLAKVSAKQQKVFLNSKKLEKYKYFLKKIFENSKFLLTEPEEKILSLKSLTSSSMWTKAVGNIKSKKTVVHNGKSLPIPEAEALVRELPTQKERMELQNKIMEVYYSIAEIAESELNAIVTDKKINDELRGFKEAYDSTILSYDNDESTVLSLVKTVTENFKISQRFYKVKAKMLNVDKIYYSDRAVRVGKTKTKYPFDESYKILHELFTKVDPKFGEILKSFVQNGQIDAFQKVGKRGGAYCSPHYKTPTFVLLNHTDSMDSLSTFAHEMGHAIHSEFTSKQPVFYNDYSMSTAEVASTLFEYFLFYDLFEKMSEEEKIVALHDKIQDDIATIFRQVACFNYELEMHNTIRKTGNMSKEELASTMNKHMKSYMGDVNFGDKDGYFFVGWPHLRFFFYVYSYAFGQLTSKVLYQKYKEDKNYIEKIKQFLSTGSSMSPEDTFKAIGLDLRNPEFWKNGMKEIESDIKLLEKLVTKSNK
jgi:oligoendopeptidase F